MEANDTGTPLTTVLEMAKMAEVLESSDEVESFVLMYLWKPSKTRPETEIKSFCSSDMTKFKDDPEVRAKFLKACTEPKNVKESKKLKDEYTHGFPVEEEQGAVNEIPDEIQLHPSSKNKRWNDGDLPAKKSEISGSQFLNLPPPLLFEIPDAAKKVPATNTNSKLATDNTDRKVKSTSASTTEVTRTISLGITVQHEREEVPRATTNSSTGRLSNTKPLDAKTAVVKTTGSIPSDIKKPPGTSTRIGQATCPCIYADGYVAKEIPGKPRTAKPANSLREWSNINKFWFIQDVSGWASGPVRGLETNRNKIVNTDWIDHISSSSSSSNIFQAMQKRRPDVKYDGTSVKDLLRFIRNVSCHYHELPEIVKTGIGRPRANALDYFTSEFPFLLDHTYDVVKQFAEDVDFASYYKIK